MSGFLTMLGDDSLGSISPFLEGMIFFVFMGASIICLYSYHVVRSPFIQRDEAWGFIEENFIDDEVSRAIRSMSGDTIPYTLIWPKDPNKQGGPMEREAVDLPLVDVFPRIAGDLATGLDSWRISDSVSRNFVFQGLADIDLRQGCTCSDPRTVGESTINRLRILRLIEVEHRAIPSEAFGRMDTRESDVAKLTDLGAQVAERLSATQ